MSFYTSISYSFLDKPGLAIKDQSSSQYRVEPDDFHFDIKTWGWVKSFRKSKTCYFAHIHQGDSQDTVQIVLDRKVFSTLPKLPFGSYLELVGRWQILDKDSQSLELLAKQILRVSQDQKDYPLQAKAQSFLFLRDHCHLRARTALFQSIFRLKSAFVQTIHQYYSDSDHCLVQAPTLTKSDCEGAGEVFTVDTQDYFGHPSVLTVSTQLELEALAMGLGKVYSLAPCFRRDPSDTPRHTSEFWMLEAELVGLSYEALIQEIKSLFQRIPQMLSPFHGYLDQICKHTDHDYKRTLTQLAGKYAQLSFHEARSILIDHDKADPLAEIKDLSAEQERFLTDTYFESPVLVTHYPKQTRAFYSKLDPTGEIAYCVDLLLPGLGEALSGGIRQDDFDMLQAEIISRKICQDELKEYLDLRRWGSAPHGGYGFGLDRILMYITGIQSIRDLQAYPRAWRAFF